VYCELRRNFVWDEGGDGSQCGVEKPEEPSAARRCVFDGAADLIATLNARNKDGVVALWPSEEAAIRAAAETIPPPPIFRWLESSLLGGLAGFVVLLFTKGVSVYGLQVLAPLRALARGSDDKDPGKEVAGTVERYRAEFGLLCRALDGRLVVFIDDLDRCAPATVNTVLEMTNYLVDVGRCFVVVGAAIDRVKQCIQSPVAGENADAYATEYLRKLIHIEMPVPLRRGELEVLLQDPPPRQDTLSFAERWSGPARVVRRSGLALAGVAALALFFAVGQYLHNAGDGVARTVVARSSAVVAPGTAPGTAPAPAARPGDSPQPALPSDDVGLSAGAPAPWPWTAFAGAALIVAAGLAWRWYRRNRDRVRLALGGALRPNDSERFIGALRIWNRAVIAHDPTPRHVKRFYNRARLFAAYESEEARLAGRIVADDAALVAMAALHHVDPACLANLGRLIALAEAEGQDADAQHRTLAADSDELFRSPASDGPVPDELKAAWRAHLETFATLPRAEDVRRFIERVRGVSVR